MSTTTAQYGLPQDYNHDDTANVKLRHHNK